MKIGVVCEGPSDFPAIKSFFGSALAGLGIETEFKPLFPEIDRTRPEGGWANVLLWLKNRPSEVRVQSYFSGGLFGGGLSVESLDVIIIQLDADAIDDESFTQFVHRSYGYDVSRLQESPNRGVEIVRVISLAGEFSRMTNTDARRHVPVPAVESTETWCVAAFEARRSNFEEFKGDMLKNRFMSALEQSEGRVPQNDYGAINKNPARRRRFCEKHAAGAKRIMKGCPHFADAVDRLSSLNT